MSNVYFISDLHFGHKNILKFSGALRGGTDSESHDEWLITQWNSVVSKRDVVYVLGDVAFDEEGLQKCEQLRGNKFLIMGNHDLLGVEAYSKYFTIRPGLFRYKGFWLSHCPIHPAELRGRPNIHGHVHQNRLPDTRYFNVCVEESYGVPVNLLDLKVKMGGG